MSKIISNILVVLFCISTYSQTTITGDISGMTFKPSGNPWIVKENVFVENGSKTVIKPGCVFLFKPFTGIIVQGSFEVERQSENPVVFTSINDSLYNEASAQKAEPFDWNGITIEKTAETVKMADFILSYSVFGIKSKRENIVLERGTFKCNGQFNFTINEKIQDAPSNAPFTYNSSEKPKTPKPTIPPKWAKPLGVGTIVTGTALLGATGYFLYSAFQYDKDYENSAADDDINYYTNKRHDALQNALITGIIGGILVPAGTGLLIWESKTGKSRKKVSFYPVTGESNGFQVVVKF